MLQLSNIDKTVAQVAEAVTAAIDIESEIVDANLKIIGGTGRYTKKIGAYEENGKKEMRQINTNWNVSLMKKMDI